MADDEWNDDPVEFDEGAENERNGGRGDERKSGTGDGADETSDDSSEWRFTLEDLAEADENEDEAEDDAGGFSLHAEIEAGSPSAESVLFVALGLALGLLIVVQFFL